MDSFTTIWNRLLNRAPSLGAILAQDLVRDSFQVLSSRREWSWLQRSGRFYPSIFYQTGTVSIAAGSVVTGVGTAWTSDLVGSQFRTSSNLPTYTILAVPSATSLVLDQPWIGPAASASSYQIFQCYFPVPEDFDSFISLVSVANNYQLHTTVPQATLDLVDAQRVNLAGNSYAASFLDYTRNFAGVVGDVVQAQGTGPSPVSTTTFGYNFPADQVFTLTVSTGGVPGGALAFTWRQEGGPSSVATSVSDNSALDLALGVQVYFPQATYVAGDVFVIPCRAQSSAALARYELWPRPINSPYVYPFLYRARLAALSDDAPQLPPQVAARGDVLLEMSLANAARTPGTAEAPNPYFSLGLALQHDQRAQKALIELDCLDDNTSAQDLSWGSLPFAPAPWLDGNFLQQHGWIGYPSLV